MIGRVRESRNPKKVIRVSLMESYGEIGRVPVNLCNIYEWNPEWKPSQARSCRRRRAHECMYLRTAVGLLILAKASTNAVKNKSPSAVAQLEVKSFGSGSINVRYRSKIGGISYGIEN